MDKNPFSDEMRARKIKKIDQIDIINFSKQKGQEIAKALKENTGKRNALLMDSLQKQGVVVTFLDSVSIVGATQLEGQILEAYYATDVKNLSDNIQEISKGSFILYNTPTASDSIVTGMYSILFKKSYLIKHLNKKGNF